MSNNQFSIKDVPLNDEATFNTICDGRTFGVFQLEGYLGRAWAKKTMPRNIDEIADLISLIRPGCLDSGMADEYVQVKIEGREPFYLHEDLEPILKPTYGSLIYQEQCMEIAVKFAKFDLLEADHLRKAIGKKLPEEMAKIKSKFVDGCVNNGYTKEVAEQIFGWIEKFGDYGFNKCLAPTNMVERESGEYVELKDIKIGDKIKSYTIKNGECWGEYYYDTVIDVIDQGEQPVYEVIFEHDFKIKCTLNHKFLCSDGIMRPLLDIKIGNFKAVGAMRLFLLPLAIKHIQFIGYIKCIDLTMASEDHNFVCQDMVVSNSHAIAYGVDAYYTAYLKTHHPIDYYMSLLKYSEFTQKPQEEIDNIVNDAKLSGICVIPPLLKLGNIDFAVDGEKIVYGLKYIKGIGDAAIEKLKSLSNATSYNHFILLVLQNSVGKNVVSGLINTGATRYFNETRVDQRLLYEIIQELSEKESKCFVEILGSDMSRNIIDIIREDVFKIATKKRKEIICELLSNYERANKSDTLKSVLAFEKLLLGATLSGSEVDLYGNSKVTYSCLECCGLKPKTKAIIGVIIEAFKEVKTKKGNNPGQLMAFLTVSDGSYKMDNVVVFPASYEKYKGLIFEGSPVLIHCMISEDGNSLFANDLEQL